MMPKSVRVPTDVAPTATGRPRIEADPPAFGHLRGLDGLRAIAVIAVVIYHAGFGALPGGFLGVEVFFVISGFLITALLLAEHRRTGRINPVAFWLRRARRLLPALFFLLAITLAFAVIVVPDEVARLRVDAVAAFAYATNWHLIAGDQSYFDSIGRPSLFLHLWSLAIEEQFYLVWPVVLGIALLAGRRVALVATLVGAAGSAVWMALQFDPATDPSRVYYGTDTRLTGLLLGAALAFVWVPSVPVPSTSGSGSRSGSGMSRRRRRKLLAEKARTGLWGNARLGWALDVMGLAALAALGLFLVAADAFEPFLYRGGLALLAIVTVALIAAVVHPRAHLGRLLDVAPLRWVGTRSYSIYLWHWPIFALTRPGFDLSNDAVSALVIRVGLTVLAAEFSYRFIERPIRGGVLGRTLTRLRTTGLGSSARTRRWPALAAAGGLAALLSILLVSVAIATPPAQPEGMLTASIDQVVVDPDLQPSDRVAAPRGSPVPVGGLGSAPGSDGNGTGSGVAAVASSSPTATLSPSPTPARGILAFGESVMLQGAKALAKDLGPLRVDAAVGRHTGDGIEILQHRAAAGELGDTVIVQLGNNGPFQDGQFDAAMEALRDVPLVVWVNVRVPRDWEAHNNRIIETGVARYPNARLVDWYAATADRPDLFWKDGYHPRPLGAELYAQLIAAAVR